MSNFLKIKSSGYQRVLLFLISVTQLFESVSTRGNRRGHLDGSTPERKRSLRPQWRKFRLPVVGTPRGQSNCRTRARAVLAPIMAEILIALGWNAAKRAIKLNYRSAICKWAFQKEVVIPRIITETGSHLARKCARFWCYKTAECLVFICLNFSFPLWGAFFLLHMSSQNRTTTESKAAHVRTPQWKTCDHE